MKRILFMISLIAYVASYLFPWLDLKTSTDLTGVSFVQQSPWLFLILALLALAFILLGRQQAIAGILLLLFLAQLFYASAYSRNLLAPGFFVTLALNILTILATLTLPRKTIGEVAMKKNLHHFKGNPDQIQKEERRY